MVGFLWSYDRKTQFLGEMTCFVAQEHGFKCNLVIPYALQKFLQDIGDDLLCMGVRIEKDQEGTSEMQGLKITTWSLLIFQEISFHQTLKTLISFCLCLSKMESSIVASGIWL